MRGDQALGILGGMGPEATADFFLKVIRLTPAKVDQEHLRVIMDSNAEIPDRMSYLSGHGEDPRPALRQTARNLEAAGAGILAIPCNTAHYFYDEIAAAVSVPVLHIVWEALKALKSDWPELERVGLLGTDQTVRRRLYHDSFEKAGLTVLTPSDPNQRRVMKAINGVKGGRIQGGHDDLIPAIRELQAAGAEILVAGCTELPIVMGPREEGLPVLDATLTLARASVLACRPGLVATSDKVEPPGGK